MSKRTVDMTAGKPAKHILRFAVPLILTNVGQQLYMIADGAIVGRGVGVKALAAVGATDWCYWLILWSVIGLTQGFSTYVSRAFGEKNYRELNKAIATSTALCLITGAVLTVLGLVAAQPVLLLLQTPADVLPDATLYLCVLLAGTGIVIAYNMAASILRALGDGRTPLVAMIIAALLNIGLDCLFVLVLDWGIAGAAVASLLAQAVSFLYCLAAIRKIDFIQVEKQDWHLESRSVKGMLFLGMPVALQYMVICLGGMVLQSGVNLQGSYFAAGYAATNKLFGLLECFALSLGLAASTFIAQNYGAGKYGRVKKGVGTTVWIATAMALCVSAIALIFGWQLVGIFIDVKTELDLKAMEAGVRYLSIMGPCFIFVYLLDVFRNALQAIGIGFWSMLSGIAELIGRLLMAKVFIHISGSDALFLSEPTAWLLALLCVMLPYFYYRKTRLAGMDRFSER
jgi:putative MATE family efflux protein